MGLRLVGGAVGFNATPRTKATNKVIKPNVWAQLKKRFPYQDNFWKVLAVVNAVKTRQTILYFPNVHFLTEVSGPVPRRRHMPVWVDDAGPLFGFVLVHNLDIVSGQTPAAFMAVRRRTGSVWQHLPTNIP